MRRGLAQGAVLFIVQAAAAQLAVAQGEPAPRQTLRPPERSLAASPITDRFALRLNYFGPTVHTDLRLDRSTGQPGTDLNAEQDLGLEEKPQQFRAEMIIRMRERNRLRVDYFKLTRFGDKVLTQQVNFGDDVFDVNDRVSSLIDWRQLSLTYTRSLIYTNRFEVGLGLGIALLEATARGEVRARNLSEQEEGVAPFPTFALDASWRISKRWSFNARGQTFTANTEDFDGSMSEYHADVQYRWRKNFAVGLGYTSLRVSLDVVSGADVDFPGRFKQDVSGPELFIRASF